MADQQALWPLRFMRVQVPQPYVPPPPPPAQWFLTTSSAATAVLTAQSFP